MHPASHKLPTEPDTVPAELRSIADPHTRAGAIAPPAERADIESESIRVTAEDGTHWWDTRLMTDPGKHSPEVIQQHTEAIRYAITYGGASVHPQQPYMLTFAKA